ncbi:carboxylesterase family protein (plasmid) [Neorhizobium galegae]|nr:carboxylesterase family protein [Neorhizobium galegae]
MRRRSLPERRFAAPQPVPRWSGIRSAKALSTVCPQIPTYGPVGKAAASTLEFGTDFLTVNIRTPSVTGSAPVLVWIHGGGYAVGSANEAVLQSGAFAASGLVEVTVNYRLGALGFLHLNDGSPDNRGLLDQIAALEWVRDNISSLRRGSQAGHLCRPLGGEAFRSRLSWRCRLPTGCFAKQCCRAAQAPASRRWTMPRSSTGACWTICR